VSEAEPGVVDERQRRQPAQGGADFRRGVADVPHQFGAGLRFCPRGNGHAPLAHAVGQENVTFVGTLFAIRHKIAAEGVHINAMATAFEERMFAFAQLLFVDREPPNVKIRIGRFALVEQRLLEERQHVSLG
jgi:hypothetical protein